MEVYSFSIWFVIFRTTSWLLSKVIHSLVSFVIIGTPRRTYLSLIVCSCNFSSFRHQPRFCLCWFFIPVFPIIGTQSRFNLSSLVGSTRFSSLGQLSRFYLCSFLFFHLKLIVGTRSFCFSAFGHHLGLMEVYSFSVLFLIFGTTSYLPSKDIHSLVWFVIIRTPRSPYLSLIVCSFNFSPFRHHRRFLLFFIPLVPIYWKTV